MFSSIARISIISFLLDSVYYSVRMVTCHGLFMIHLIHFYTFKCLFLNKMCSNTVDLHSLKKKIKAIV